MQRIPDWTVDTLTPAQRQVHDAILSGPRGIVEGPLRVWLQSPQLAPERTSAWRFLPLRHQPAGAFIGTGDSDHRRLLARGLRMACACADRHQGRRVARDCRGHPHRRHARNLRRPMRRPSINSRASFWKNVPSPMRPISPSNIFWQDGRGRSGGHPGLLRLDLHDHRRFSGADSEQRAGAVRGPEAARLKSRKTAAKLRYSSRVLNALPQGEARMNRSGGWNEQA